MQRHTRPSVRSTCTAIIAQLAALLMCGSLQASDVRIELHAKATTSGPMIRLADVATVAAEADRKATLSKLALAPAPAGGRDLVMTIADLRDRLSALGVGQADIEFTGASSVTVRGPAVEAVEVHPAATPAVTEHARRRMQQLIGKSVQKYLETQWNQAADHTVLVELTGDQVAAFSKAITARYEIAGGRSPWVGKQTFAVSYQKSGGQFAVIPVKAVIQLRPRCLVPKMAIAAGELVAASDLEWKVLDAEPDDARPVATKAAQIVGTEAKRALRAGEPILLSDVRQQPLVRRGDIVTVTCRRGVVSVSTHAKATADGVLGESIPVTTIEGSRKLVAVVTGYHEVELPGASPARTASESTEVQPDQPTGPQAAPSTDPIERIQNLPGIAVASSPGGAR